MELTKELIEQMIMEELEKLDEFKVTVNPWPTKKGKEKTSKALGITKKQASDATNKAVGSKHHTKWKALSQQLAGLGGNSAKDIDKGDFKKAKAQTGSAINKFADQIQKDTTDTAIKADWAGTGSPTSSGPWGSYVAITSTMSATALYTAMKKAADGYINSSGSDTQAKDALTAYLARYKSKGYTSKSKQTAKIFKAAGFTSKETWDKVIDELLKGVSTGALVTDQNLLGKLKSVMKAINKGIAYTDRKYSDFMGQSGVVDVSRANISTATDNTIKAVKTQADSSVLSQFGIYDGESIESIIADLSAIAEQIKTKNFAGVTNKFEFITKVNLLTKLGALGKGVDDSAAGFEFEKYCALLFGGAQVGGDNGAADAYGILASGQAVATSQKFFKNTSTIKQSRTTMDKLFKRRGEIYFISAIKSGTTAATATGGIGNLPTGKGGAYANLDIFLTKVTQTGSSSSIKYEAQNVIYDPAGSKFGDKYTCKDDGDVYIYMAKSGSGAASDQGAKQKTDNLFVRIPVLQVKDEDVFAVAEFAHEQLSSTGSPLKKLSQAIQGIFKRLQNMQYNTEEYVGVKGGSKFNKKRAAGKYIDEIAKDYTEVKDSYKDMFTVAGTSDLRRAKSKGIAENENNLDKVLDKLIKEVILNK